MCCDGLVGEDDDGCVEFVGDVVGFDGDVEIVFDVFWCEYDMWGIVMVVVDCL